MNPQSSPSSGSNPATDRLFSGRAFVAILGAARDVGVARWKSLAAVLACCFAIALALRPFDAGWMEPVKSGRDPSLIRLAESLSHWGEFHLGPLILLAIVGALGWALRRREWIYGAVSGVLAGAGAGLIVMVLKVVFGRPRPSEGIVDGFYWFKFGAAWASFPSGHATHCFAMATGLSMVLPKTWPVSLAAAFAVAWSRYYLDRHYPTDLLMGACLGVCLGVVFGLAARCCLNPPTGASAAPVLSLHSP